MTTATAAPPGRPAPLPPRSRPAPTRPTPKAAVSFGRIDTDRGQSIVLFGCGGAGKSTLSAIAPGPVAFIDLDDSLAILAGQLPDDVDIRLVEGIASLKAALGWDGRDPFWLQDEAAQLARKPVQLRLALEDYNGSKSLKVQFLNPYGWAGPGAAKADDPTRRKIAHRLGSKLRALTGGTPANPPKPAGRPAAPATRPSAPGCSMEEAWSAFCAAYEGAGPGGSSEDREQQWFSAIGQLLPGRQVETLTNDEWAKVRELGPTLIAPF